MTASSSGGSWATSSSIISRCGARRTLAGRLMMAQYKGVCPSMLRSCRIEDSETCWRAQAAAQLSRTPNDAVAFSAQVTPFVEAEVTRSRTSS